MCFFYALNDCVMDTAGDSLAGGITWAVSQGLDPRDWVKAGLSTAKLSVESQFAVSPLVTADAVRSLMGTIEE